MTKKCKVTYHNPALKTIVFTYDGRKVQLSGDYKLYGDDVYVDYADGVYLSVDRSMQKTSKNVNATTVKNKIKKDEL